jgi:hypothetical protein
VNRARDQLLSCATLTGDQNSGIARRNPPDLRGHAADRLGSTDDLLEHGRRQNLVAKVERFLVQLPGFLQRRILDFSGYVLVDCGRFS